MARVVFYISMSEKLFIPVLLGTNREGRESEKAAQWLTGLMEKRGDITTRLIDVRDFVFPQVGYGRDIKDQFPEYRDTIQKADGLLIVSPEYNHGYPGILKSVLDLLMKEYFHKAVGIAGVSSGMLGGARMIEHLLPLMREFGLVPIFKHMIFPNIKTFFDEAGNPKEEKYLTMGEDFIEELVWMAKTLKWGRNNLPTKFRQ